MNSIPLKPCKECGKEFPETTEYFRKTGIHNGKIYLSTRCLTCQRTRDAENSRKRLSDPIVREHVNFKRRQKYADNPEPLRKASRESLRRRMQINPDKIRAVKRDWQRRNKHKCKISRVRWESKNRTRKNVVGLLWHKNNPERSRTNHQIWNKSHPGKLSEYK